MSDDVNDNMKVWDAVCRPPTTALRKISGGRLTGKSDINPQWRIKAMTEAFGPCGVGWKFTIDRLWTVPGDGGAVFAFAQVSVWVRDPAAAAVNFPCDSQYWSAPIPGVGGHKLIEPEKSGLYNNDEAFKMSVTDALGTAFKMLGVAADIYLGNFDGSKYTAPPDQEVRKQEEAHKKLLADALAASMKLLEVAAEDGHDALKLAWGALTQTGREACKEHWGRFKERALAVDAEKAERGGQRVKK